MLDQRLYSTIKLPNNLEIVLVSDSNAKKSAVGMSVKVGLMEKTKITGIANLCAHMLFSGKETANSEFDELVFANNGYRSGFVTSDKTSIFYEVDLKEEERAMRLFSKAISSPEFNGENLEKMIEVINSDFENYVNSDEKAQEVVIRESIFNQAHPYAHLNIGNFNSFNKEATHSELIEDLRMFHNKFYSAENIKVSFYSNKGLEEMAAMAKQSFGSINSSKTQTRVLAEVESERAFNVSHIPELLAEASVIN